MDPLTKSLIVTSWGNFGIGVVHRDEKLTEKDKAVHNAKKALKSLKDGFRQGVSLAETQKQMEDLYNALLYLENIQQNESFYFNRRYYEEDKDLVKDVKNYLETPQAKLVKAERVKTEIDADTNDDEQARGEAKKALQDEQEQAKKQREAAEAAARTAEQAAQTATAEQKTWLATEAREKQRIAAEKRRFEAELKRAMQASLETWEKEKEERAQKARDAALENEKAAKQEKRLADKARQKKVDEQNAPDEAARQQAASEWQVVKKELRKAKDKAAAVANDAEMWRRRFDASPEEQEWLDPVKKGWMKKWRIVDKGAGGDCLMHALCHFYKPGDPDCHLTLRGEIVHYMISHLDDMTLFDAGTFREIIYMTCKGQLGEQSVWRSIGEGAFFNEIPASVERYLDLMSKQGTYCTDLEIAAFERMKGIIVHKTMSFNVTTLNPPPFNDPSPDDPKTYYIYYTASGQGGHYQALERIK